LGGLILLGSWRLSHVDAALVGYTFDSLFAVTPDEVASLTLCGTKLARVRTSPGNSKSVRRAMVAFD